MAKDESITEEDKLELTRRRLVDEVRESVEKDLRRRYSWLGLLFVVITGSMFTLLVDRALNNATKELTKAEAVQDQASLRLTEAATQAEESAGIVAGAEALLREKAVELDSKFAEAENRLQSVAVSSALVEEVSRAMEAGFAVSESLRQDLSDLSDIVKDLSNQKSATDDVVSLLGGRTDGILMSLAAAESLIYLEKSRARLSKYPVVVFAIPGSSKLIHRLRLEGFTIRPELFLSSGTEIQKSAVQYAAVVVPDEAPVEEIRKVLRVAREECPALAYIVIDTDFIGVSGFAIGQNTAWAIAQTKRLTKEEFDSLLEDHVTSEQFQDRVRSYYKKNLRK